MSQKQPECFTPKRNKKFRIFSMLVLFMFLTISMTTFAQAPGFDDDVNDEPPAPIDNEIILLTIGGIGLGFWFLNKNNRINFTKK